MNQYIEPIVEWLGTTPRGWSQPRLKSVFRDNTGSISIERLAELQVQHYSIPNFDEFGAPASEDGATIASNKTLLRGGEILYSKLNCHKPRVWLVPHDDKVKVASTEFIPLVEWHSASVDKGFVTYLIGSAVFAEYMSCFQTSVTNSHRRINPNDLWQTRLPLPPLPEQQRIAAYLDASCAAIDAAVAAKRRQLETLNALNRAIALKAVTQGLNPNVTMRRTGVDWIPNIPAHWKISKLNTLFWFRKGDKAMELTQKYIAEYPGEFPVYSGQTADEGLMGSIDSFEFDFTSPVVFVTTVGAKAMTTRIVSGRFSLSQNCALLIPWHRGVNVDYFEPATQALFDFERRSIALIMQPSLRFKDLRKFRLPVPPRDEQREIVAFLKGEAENIAGIVSSIESQIDMLTAYRKSLIHECVTGQRRVTEADINRVKAHG